MNDTVTNRNILNIPVAKVGRWYRNNRVIRFTMNDLKSMVNNFKNKVLSFNPFLTYGHLVDTTSIDSHRKKGDILDLYINGNTLWAKAIAKDETYNSVVKGEYEHSSGEFIFDYTNPSTGLKTGAVLLRLALTNSPFLPLEKIEALSCDIDDKDIEVFSIKVDVSKLIMENENKELEQLKSQVGAPESSTESPELDSSLNEPSITEELVVDSEPISSITEEPTKVSEESLDSNKEESKPEVQVADKVEQVESILEDKESLSIKLEEPINKKANMTKSIQISDPRPNEINIQGIADSIRVQLEATYGAKLEKLMNQNESLVQQLEAREEEISSLRTQTKTQSLSLSATQQQMLKVQDGIFEEFLEANGAPPVIIQKAMELRNAIMAGDDLVKLSNSEGQVIEQSYSQYISDLVVSALKVYPIEPSQSGVSRFSMTSSPFDSTGSHLYLSEVIRRNNAKVNNQV